MDAVRLPRPVVHVHPLQHYGFGQKPEKDWKTETARLAGMESRYAEEGFARRTVEAVLLVVEHGHPHLLLLQARGGCATAALCVTLRLTRTLPQLDSKTFALPGGRLKPGEEESEGLIRKLSSKLAPAGSGAGVPPPAWEVGELLATWTRPHFEPNLYPYCPPHVTRPVETRHLYLVHLPERCFFAVPRNQKLVAVPLFELHGNAPKFGTQVAAVPALLSRFLLHLHTPE